MYAYHKTYLVWSADETPAQGVRINAATSFNARKVLAAERGRPVADIMARLAEDGGK